MTFPEVLLVLISTGISGEVRADQSKDLIRVAAVQMKMRWYRDANDFRTVIDGWVEKAKAAGADLVVFPEDVGLPLIGLGDVDSLQEFQSGEQAIPFLVKKYSQAVDPLVAQHAVTPQRALLWTRRHRYWPTYLETFMSAARRFGVYIAAGSSPHPSDSLPPRVYNTAVFVNPKGRILGLSTKVNLIPLEKTMLDLAPAESKSVPLFRSPIGAVAIPICYDCHFPDLLAPLGTQGVEILIDPRANPDHWSDQMENAAKTGLYTRVRELGCFGVECFMVGDWMGMPFEGRSWILAPSKDGSPRILARAKSHDQEELVVADLDMNLVRKK